MTSDGHNTGGSGFESVRVTVLTFTYNHDTHEVTISGTPLPLALAQMIAGEGMRLLEEQRRIAAAKQMRAQLEEQSRVQGLVNSIRGGG